MGLLKTIEDAFFKNFKKETNMLDSPIQNYKIMGLPLHYTSLTDPTGRVFANTILADIPVVTILPGRPQFLDVKTDADFVEEDSLVKLMAKQKGVIDGDEKSIIKYLKKNQKADTDMRYYGFRNDYSEYFKYVQLMLSTVRVKMGLPGIYNFGKSFQAKFGDAGLAYFFDRSSSISEGATNDFSQSKLQGLSKSASGIRRELDFILGTGKASMTDLENMEDKGNAQITKQLDDAKSGEFAASLMDANRGGINKLTTVLNGSQLLFPEIWQDSTFSRNYTLNFKLYSPYGDPLSIFENIYVPFISMLALTLPKQDTLVGYYSPFVVRVDSPGYFTCDLGVITNMTFKKGGSDDLWSKDGLPLAMDVTLTIKDLYPTLMMSKSYSVMGTNIGLSGFLDNLAGVHVTDLKIDENIETWLKSKLSKITGLPTYAVNEINTRYANAVARINDLFQVK